ncbi:unnamed protein product [Brassicogethes aeneus]|uniref:Uncharacterized protein n=1 Tax=Brassicogethes aeneus TaxID=1431903 RepID=A0A9P0FN62_BRAAE|nr:unnamed protein product [Brassicogethes aeneus]
MSVVISLGNFDGTEKLDYEDTVAKAFQLLQTVTETSSYSTSSPNIRIKCVRIWDLWNDGTNGQAQIIQGGPGWNSVKVHYQSQFGRGMKFKLQVFI